MVGMGGGGGGLRGGRLRRTGAEGGDGWRRGDGCDVGV